MLCTWHDIYNVMAQSTFTQPQQCLPGIQDQISGIFCYFLSDFLCYRTYPSSRTHGPSLTSNIQPVETTLPSLCVDPLATVTSTLIVCKASDVNNFSSTKPYRQDINIYLAREMEYRFHPLMLPDKFLNKYLPLNDPKLVCPESNWSEIYPGMKEVGMYLLFVSFTLCSCQLAHTEI